MSRDEDEDLFRKREQMLAALEAPAPTSKRRRYSVEDGAYVLPSERLDHIDDEIRTAIDVSRAMPTADDLTLKAQIRAQKHVDLDQQAPFMRKNPVSILQGTLGGRQTVTLTAEPQQLAQWAGNDAETTVLNVTVAPVPFAIPGGQTNPTPSIFMPVGRVRWGTRSTSMEVLFDILKGACFNIGASYASLEAYLEVNDFQLTADPAATLDFTGMLSVEPIVRTTPLTFTRYFIFAGAGTQLIRIPNFARQFRVFRNNQATALTIQTLLSTGGVLTDFVLAGGTQQFDPLPIPSGAEFVGITSAGIAVGPVIFDLGIG